MTPPSAVAGLRRFSLAELPREPWKNRAGWTRTIASRQDADGVTWRISVADISAAGPFSRFEGMDRTAVMVRGGRLRLSNEVEERVFDGPASWVQFPGELDWHCDAPEISTQLWNVMVRRGHTRAEVRIVRDEAVALPQAPDVLVLVLRGQFDLVLSEAEPWRLGVDEGLQLQNVNVPLSLTPRQTGSLLLVTALF